MPMPAMREVIISEIAIGGVNWPMARLIVIITPNHTRSQPIATAIGTSSGSRIRKIEIASRNIPAASSSRLIDSSISHSLECRPTSAFAAASKMPSVLPAQANTEAMPMIISTTADSSPASTSTRNRPRKLMLRYTTMPTKMP